MWIIGQKRGRGRSGRVTNGPFDSVIYRSMDTYSRVLIPLIRAGDSPIFDRISLRRTLVEEKSIRFVFYRSEPPIVN